jgi:hypothetical protein
MGADDEQPKRGFKVPTEKKVAERAAKDAELMSWREKYSDASKIKFDDKRKAIYLNVLRKTGLRHRSAQAAGVTMQTVNNHLASDEHFKIARDEALAEYADIIQQHAFKISVKGVKKPLLGGKDKDEIVAYEEVYATNILAMEMKRTNPDYKDRQEIDLNHTGGSVLVAPADMTPAEWIKQQTEKNKGKKEPGADEQ